jgi:hypothetical protein
MYMYGYVQIVGLTNSNNLVNSFLLLSLTYHLYYLRFKYTDIIRHSIVVTVPLEVT